MKSRLAYVPDQVAFYPWMTIRQTLDYLASFRSKMEQGDRTIAAQPVPAAGTSKGEQSLPRTKGAGGPDRGCMSRTGVVAADEPTSGLDPIVRREFIETVIGAYQETDPGNRTIFVSTHLISEFEGLIDEFTIIDQGKVVLTLNADIARGQYKRIRMRFAQEPPKVDFPEILQMRREARELELVVRENGHPIMDKITLLRPESVTTEALALEEIFVATLK